MGRLRTSNFELRTSNFELRTSNFEVGAEADGALRSLNFDVGKDAWGSGEAERGQGDVIGSGANKACKRSCRLHSC